MTPKERAAMQRALEALEDIFGKGKVDVGAITALREALAEPEDMFIGFDAALKEAMENDPLYQMGYDAALAEQAEQEPVGVVEGSGEWGIAGVLVAGVSIGTKLYAAPVRTKDLTDDEIMKINVDTASIVPTCDRQFHFARAVIAADREKNK